MFPTDFWIDKDMPDISIEPLPSQIGPRRISLEQYGKKQTHGHEINEEGRIKLVSLRPTNKRPRSEVDDEDHSFSYGNQPKRFKSYHGQEKVPT